MRSVSDVPGVAALLADGWEVVEPDLWEEWPEALRRTVPDTRPEMARSPFPEERDVRLVRPLGPRLTVDDARVLLHELVAQPELADVPEDGPADPALLRWREDRAALLREPVDALVDRWHTAGLGGRLHAEWEAAGVEAAGVEAAASSPWRSRAAGLPLRDAWRAAGVPDEEALAWLEWRPEPFGPDVRAAFVAAADGDVEEALGWSRAGIEPRDVACWRRTGLGPEAPRVFRAPGAAEPYREVGLSAEEATEAAGAHLSAADAVRWKAAGVRLEEVMFWEDVGSPEEAARWLAAGFALDAALTWAGAGWTPQDARRAYDEGRAPLRNFGVIARADETLEETLHRHGFPPAPSGWSSRLRALLAHARRVSRRRGPS